MEQILMNIAKLCGGAGVIILVVLLGMAWWFLAIAIRNASKEN